MSIPLSIIVPVYNVGKYLDQCLETLVNQTFGDIEIIVVDDASPDNSWDIIKEYENKYSSKIISMRNDANKGQGYSRNVGLSMARGEYIGFVDPDDWVDLQMFECLYSRAKEGGFDIVMCDMFRVDESNKKKWIYRGYSGDIYPPAEVRDFMCSSLDPAMAWNKIFRNELFEKALFPDEIWYEDMGLVPILLSYAQKIGYLEKPLYFYRQSPQSITSSKAPRTLGVLEAWDRIITLSNPEYRNEIIFAVYKSINTFMEFKVNFINIFFEFFKQRECLFSDNSYIRNHCCPK